MLRRPQPGGCPRRRRLPCGCACRRACRAAASWPVRPRPIRLPPLRQPLRPGLRRRPPDRRQARHGFGLRGHMRAEPQMRLRAARHGRGPCLRGVCGVCGACGRVGRLRRPRAGDCLRPGAAAARTAVRPEPHRFRPRPHRRPHPLARYRRARARLPAKPAAFPRSLRGRSRSAAPRPNRPSRS